MIIRQDYKTKVVYYQVGGSDIKKTNRKIIVTKKDIAERHLKDFYKSLPKVTSKQKPINSKFFTHCKKFK